MATQDYAGKSAYRGDVAASYDRDRVVEPLWATEQAWVEAWAATLPRGTVVMDLPAGTGRFVDLLLARGLKVQALDISDDMLAELRKRPAAANPDLAIARGDAERLEAAEGSVDYVLCWRLFHLLPLPTIERVLAEFRRVCRGQIVVQVLPVRLGGVAAMIPAAAKALLRPLRRWFGGQQQTPWSHISSYVHVERDLLRRFAGARLKVVSTATMADYAGRPVRVYTLERDGP